ncbi:hypothetical protein HPP92_019808 [Vanilla planifolia]|uniref:Cytochrome b561 domain-containing protein n=1 Tax=Vanilla planifolia TaxID=51239 RepID=A0A835Q9P8_VANPL|nr:hypothetical protein HPP92_019808 [Vanilla planifolia]
MQWILIVARLWGFVVAGLVLVWALFFKTSFLPRPSGAGGGDGDAVSHLDHIYSALHPLLMVVGFILLSGEAILVHRRFACWSRSTRKSVHLLLQALALGFGLFGVWAKFRGNEGIVANFYSLHSWIGLACLALFAYQWAAGFSTFWHKAEGRRTRSTVLPRHVGIGLYTFGLAVAAAETGLQEKLTFLQSHHGLGLRSPESAFINSLGIALALLAGVVVLAAVSPRKQQAAFGGGEESRNEKLHV